MPSCRRAVTHFSRKSAGRSQQAKSILAKLQKLIAKGQFSKGLQLIELKLGYSGDAAQLVLAIAQQLSTPLPSLPDEGGEQ